MANVVCKYTYKPTILSNEIVNADACAVTEDTAIIVPEMSVSRPAPTDCEQIVKIKYHISGPPAGGLEITHVYVDFYYTVVKGGSVGLTGFYQQHVDFPAANEVNPSAESTFTYEIPVGSIRQALEGEYMISFWPQTTAEDEPLSKVTISDVRLRMAYRNLSLDPDIGVAQNIQVYPNHWARVAVKWSAAICANGKQVDHYSIGVFAMRNHNTADQTVDGGVMVSDGWRSIHGTSAFIELVAPQPSEWLFVKIVAVSTQNKRGVLTCSTGSNSYSIPIALDTLEDANEVMFSFGNMRVAYNHVGAQAAFLGRMDAPTWDLNDSDKDDMHIRQSDYDRLANYIGVDEIPNVTYSVETQVLVDDQGQPILDDEGGWQYITVVHDPSQTMMQQSQWAALIAKV